MDAINLVYPIAHVIHIKGKKIDLILLPKQGNKHK